MNQWNHVALESFPVDKLGCVTSPSRQRQALASGRSWTSNLSRRTKRISATHGFLMPWFRQLRVLLLKFLAPQIGKLKTISVDWKIAPLLHKKIRGCWIFFGVVGIMLMNPSSANLSSFPSLTSRATYSTQQKHQHAQDTQWTHVRENTERRHAKGKKLRCWKRTHKMNAILSGFFPKQKYKSSNTASLLGHFWNVFALYFWASAWAHRPSDRLAAWIFQGATDHGHPGSSVHSTSNWHKLEPTTWKFKRLFSFILMSVSLSLSDMCWMSTTWDMLQNIDWTLHLTWMSTGFAVRMSDWFFRCFVQISLKQISDAFFSKRTSDEKWILFGSSGSIFFSCYPTSLTWGGWNTCDSIAVTSTQKTTWIDMNNFSIYLWSIPFLAWVHFRAYGFSPFWLLTMFAFSDAPALQWASNFTMYWTIWILLIWFCDMHPQRGKFQTDACCNECMLESLEMLECRTFTDDSGLWIFAETKLVVEMKQICASGCPKPTVKKMWRGSNWPKPSFSDFRCQLLQFHVKVVYMCGFRF